MEELAEVRRLLLRRRAGKRCELVQRLFSEVE